MEDLKIPFESVLKPGNPVPSTRLNRTVRRIGSSFCQLCKIGDICHPSLAAAMDLEIRSRKVRVLPIVIDDCEIPSFLARKLCADLRMPDRFELGISSILRKLAVSGQQSTQKSLATTRDNESIGDRSSSHFITSSGSDEYGRWIELSVKDVTQRLRWINPGEFWMGAPKSEPGVNHGLLHRERVAHGFWLSNTACTQELWKAVMGYNPSHFTDDAQNPVEMVSWHDVQEFLLKIQTKNCGACISAPDGS
jgi:Sulfatase-modifying factor enzyme 1